MPTVYTREDFDKRLQDFGEKMKQYLSTDRYLVSFEPIPRVTNMTAINSIKNTYKPTHTDYGQYDNSVLWIFSDKDVAQKAATAIKRCKATQVTLNGEPV